MIVRFRSLRKQPMNVKASQAVRCFFIGFCVIFCKNYEPNQTVCQRSNAA